MRLAGSCYTNYSTMGQALAEQLFNLYEDAQKWLDGRFLSKGDAFF